MSKVPGAVCPAPTVVLIVGLSTLVARPVRPYRGIQIFVADSPVDASRCRLVLLSRADKHPGYNLLYTTVAMLFKLPVTLVGVEFNENNKIAKYFLTLAVWSVEHKTMRHFILLFVIFIYITLLTLLCEHL